MWPAFTFNLVASLIIAGLFIRSVRRLECRMDAWYRKFNEWADAEDAKFDIARDEIRTSMRVQTDRAIAEMLTKAKDRPAEKDNAEELQDIDTETPAQAVGEYKNIAGSGTLKGIIATGSGSVKTVRPSLAEGVPTEAEIELLPRWSQVAFATRCARRVLGLLPQLWPDLLLDDVQTVEKSVAHAESIAATGRPDPGIKNVFKLGAVDAAHKIAAEAQSRHHIGAGAVASAAATAMYAAYTDAVTRQTYSTAYNAEFASSKLDPPVSITTIIRRDFDHIVKLAKQQTWTDDSPVPPSVFGPLWPDGPPEGWPMLERVVTEIVFEFDAPDDLITVDAVEFAKEVAAAICVLDLTGSGHGLAIQPPLEITAPVPAPAGVPR